MRSIRREEEENSRREKEKEGFVKKKKDSQKSRIKEWKKEGKQEMIKGEGRGWMGEKRKKRQVLKGNWVSVKKKGGVGRKKSVRGKYIVRNEYERNFSKRKRRCMIW